MNIIFVLLIVLAIVAAVALIIKIVLPSLEKRGINVQAVLDRTAQAVATAQKALDAIAPFIRDSVDMNILDKISAAAHEGTQAAEQLYKIGQLQPEDRKAEATKFVSNVLKLAGIEETEDVKYLVSHAIESQVFDLGHNEG